MQNPFTVSRLPLLLLVSFGCLAQEESESITSGIIEAPDTWSKESFALPPSFAPDLGIIGVEEVRFAPGWDDPASTQFWTYTFAWYLDGDVRLTEQHLEKLTEDYFSGLTKSVGSENGTEKVGKAQAQFTALGDSTNRRTFEGTVELLDVFFTQKQIKLNTKVRANYCPEIDKHLMLFSFSIKGFEDDVWKIFDRVTSPPHCRALQQATLASFTTQETNHYELILPKTKPTGTLLLFPGFPETPEVVKREFKIIAPAVEAGIAVAFMKFNQKLWLEEKDRESLSDVIRQLFEENDLAPDNVYIGGFSSGGTVSLLISNHLIASQSDVQPRGVFAIDSPVDLLGLYENSRRNIERNFSPVSVQESKMVVGMLESRFGPPEDGIEPYEAHAVYTLETHNTENVSHLQDTEIRLYTEPDTTWWKQNRRYEYEEMNAYFIKHLADDLTEEFGDKVAYIATENRGYRSNGDRHPHSWSIVDVDDLVRWITE